MKMVKNIYGNNSKSKNAILFGVSQSELVKVMYCKYAKEVWVNLNQIHEGDDKVKQVKLQTFKMGFESLRMSDDESITYYFLNIDEVTNMIIGFGEEVKEEMIVHKILRSFPMRINAKVSATEEMANLKDLKMDQLHGTLTTYWMRVGREKSKPKEVAFKVSKK